MSVSTIVVVDVALLLLTLEKWFAAMLAEFREPLLRCLPRGLRYKPGHQQLRALLERPTL